MKKLLLICASALAVSSVNAAVLFTENFDSYADNDALEAGQWEDTTQNVGISSADAHSGSQSYEFASNNSGFATAGFTGFTPSTGGSLVATYWLRDHGNGLAREGLMVANYANGQFGSGAVGNILYFGPYSTSGQGNYYSRVAFGTGSGYVAANARKTGWVELRIEVGTYFNANTVRFFVDDVMVPASDRVVAPIAWNCLKIGTGAGTALKTAYIDDITIESVTPAVPVSVSGLWID